MPTTNHYDIFNYWKNKVILSDGSIVESVEGGIDTMNDPAPVVYDWGEPSCWACDRPVKNLPITEDLKILWTHPKTKSLLNRCHIIPRLLGGKDKPSNLFLMCSECHSLSPDSTNVKAFFRWVYDRRRQYVDGKMSIPYLFSKIDEELKRRGLSPMKKLLESISHTPKIKSSIDLKNYLKKHASVHSTGISDSTWVIVITDWFLYEFIGIMPE